MENTNPFFLVLGMHRSGTSCLTGSLERCGVFLGTVKREGRHNKKGFFENEEVFKIQDQILFLNKSKWHSPPNHPIKVHSHFRLKLQTIVNQLKIKKKSGLKDPRSLLLLDFWKELIGTDLQLIGTFRHPLAVAQSLLVRNNIPIEKGIELWIIYNTILVKEHLQNPFPIIHFDLSNTTAYLQNIKYIAKELNLQPQKLRLRWFISSKLEHHRFERQEVPESCRKLYDYLFSAAKRLDFSA